MTEFLLDRNLQPYATPRQWEMLVAWERAGSVRAAAKVLGVHHRLVSEAKARVLKKAARSGYAPDCDPPFHARGRVPAGFILKGQSALIAEDGRVLQRWDKTKQEGMDPSEAVRLPDPKKTTKLSSMLGADGRVIVQWVAEKPEDGARERAWREFSAELARDVPRIAPTPPPATTSKQLLAAYPVGDHHLGMLSWQKETGANYDLEIGERLLCGAMNYLASAAGSAEQAVVAFLGDFMHYDGFEAVTPTNRNILDSDGRFPKMVWAAVRCMRHAIDTALRAHGRVHVIVEPGNHDLASSVFLATCLSIAYEKEQRVTVDTSPAHYHYFRFGKVLLGTHHGHGAKMDVLPIIMAADRPKDWGETRFRYFWTGHIHQSRIQQDYSGCVVESFRVLPPADAWAAQKGYRPHRDMKAVVFHRQHGEVARHTVNPNMIAP